MNTIIVDETNQAAGEELAALCGFLNSAVNEYISIISGIRTDALIEGKAAVRYDSYKSGAAALSGRFETLGKMLNLTMTGFVEAVDAADEYLY